MFAAAALLLCTAGCRDEGVGRWVDPNIGGVAPLLTTVMPQVHRPHAMVRIYPVTTVTFPTGSTASPSTCPVTGTGR